MFAEGCTFVCGTGTAAVAGGGAGICTRGMFGIGGNVGATGALIVGTVGMTIVSTGV